VLGGTPENQHGTIHSDPNLPGSDIRLYSMDDVWIFLGEDEVNEAAFFVGEDIPGPKVNALFAVVGGTGDTYVEGAIDTRGPACLQFEVPGAGQHAVSVPGFCMDAFCWVTLRSDGIFGAMAPGLLWPVLYMQDTSDNSWVGGPAMSIAGISLSGGMGVNGDGRGAGVLGGGETQGGGLLSVLDDSAAENASDKWTVEFQPYPGELSEATLFVCPMGYPTPSYWGGDK
jgi:hypothetical protein